MTSKFLNRSVLQCAAAIVFGLFASQVSSAQAQAQYVAQVQAQLDKIETLLTGRGYEETHTAKIAQLAQGGKKRFTLDLRKGMEYILAGVCDNDCTDLDIKIYDENDVLLTSDDQQDDKPVVGITPKLTGIYQIEITMYKCGNSPCAYGIGVYGK